MRLFYLSFQLLFFAKLSNKIKCEGFFFSSFRFPFLSHTLTLINAQHYTPSSIWWFLFHGLNHHFRIHHKAPRLPPLPPPKKRKFCIISVLHFSWVLHSSKEKSKTMVMQNFFFCGRRGWGGGGRERRLTGCIIWHGLCGNGELSNMLSKITLACWLNISYSLDYSYKRLDSLGLLLRHQMYFRPNNTIALRIVLKQPFSTDRL